MTVQENELGPEQLEKLKDALQGLNTFYLALVWEFCEHLIRLQSSQEDYEKAKKN